MKTLREWIDTVEDSTIKQKWLDNANSNQRDKNYLNRSSISLHDALAASFTWAGSNEDYFYWDNIYTTFKYQ